MYWLNYLDRNAIALAKRKSIVLSVALSDFSEHYRRRPRIERRTVPNLCLHSLRRLCHHWYPFQHVDHPCQGTDLPRRRHDDLGRYLYRHRSHQELHGLAVDAILPWGSRSPILSVRLKSTLIPELAADLIAELFTSFRTFTPVPKLPPELPFCTLVSLSSLF
jgi:hypothetical protein